MKIEYKSTKEFTPRQLQNLFLSLGWVSGNYPHRLVQGMAGSDTVFSAWDGETLVGLVNVLDDGGMAAYIHFLLVHPDYQGKHIGGELMNRVMKKYESYLCMVLLSETGRTVPFYEKYGFTVCEGSVPMRKMDLDT